MVGFLDAPSAVNEIKSYLTDGTTDYYQAGKVFGGLWRKFFDQTLNNWLGGPFFLLSFI